MTDYRRIFRYVFFVTVVLLVVGVEIGTARGGRGGGSRGGYRGGSRGSRGSGSFAWKAEVVRGLYFGSRHYTTRRRFYSGQAPQICENYKYQKSNNSINAISYHGKFVCPMGHQPDDYDYCCGQAGSQTCCSFGDDPGRVVGLIIGPLFLFGIIGLVIFSCCKYQNRRKKQPKGVVKHANNFNVKQTTVPPDTGYSNRAGTYPPPADAYPPAAGTYPPAGGYPQPGAPAYMHADIAAPPYPGAVPPSYEKSQKLPYSPNPTVNTKIRRVFLDVRTGNGRMREYFRNGYSISEMQRLLRMEHGISISIRQIRRVLNKLGLQIRGQPCFDTAVAAIRLEVEEIGPTIGYRVVQQRLLSRRGLSVPRDLVSEIQQAVDPEGVESRRHRLRRRRYTNLGPNFLINVDAYDKLNRYGFAIHGAVCGFSRRVLWHKVSASNNDPRVVATNFMQYVKDIKGVPRCIRCDHGTENVLMEEIQKGMRWEHQDDMARTMSVIKGLPPSNQRIKRWWRSSREGGGAFWIDIMKNLEYRGLLSTGNSKHIECARYCFGPLLEADMAQCAEEWNQHHIRHTANSESPRGKPNMMYYQPELYGTVDYKTFVDPMDITAVIEEFCLDSISFCDPEFQEHCDVLLLEYRRVPPTNTTEAIELFCWLCTEMESAH